MKVLIADKLSQRAVDELRGLGLEVTVHPDLGADQLVSALDGVEILIVRSTLVPAEAIAAGSQLSLVLRAGAGVNTIDVAAASSRGIYVANCPGMNTAAVAELAIGLLIAADRRIADAAAALRSGAWKKKEFGTARGLKGRRLGIVGLGAIGRAVAQRAQGLEMQVAAWSRSLSAESAEEQGVHYYPTPEELAADSDAVSVHLALAPETRGLLGRSFFEAMRPGATFINTARGELVDTAALIEAIERKQLRVGLDVFEGEPASGDARFENTALANLVTGTPHIGASTDQASEAIAAEVVRIVSTFLKTGQPPGAVNLCERSPATHHLVVRHLNHVGVLASVLDGLRAEGINVEEMNNTVFAGAEAACCTLQLDQPPSEELLEGLRQNGDILQVLLQPHRSTG